MKALWKQSFLSHGKSVRNGHLPVTLPSCSTISSPGLKYSVDNKNFAFPANSFLNFKSSLRYVEEKMQREGRIQKQLLVTSKFHKVFPTHCRTKNEKYVWPPNCDCDCWNYFTFNKDVIDLYSELFKTGSLKNFFNVDNCICLTSVLLGRWQFLPTKESLTFLRIDHQPILWLLSYWTYWKLQSFAMGFGLVVAWYQHFTLFRPALDLSTKFSCIFMISRCFVLQR